MKRLFLISLAVFPLIFSCQTGDRTYPENVNAVLELADDNADELQSVLEHYSQPEDSLKYQAACFLIGNMGEKHAWVNFELQGEDGNAVAFNVLDYENYDALLDAWDKLEDKHGELNFKTSDFIRDYDTITSEFLIKNIDLAFRAWEEKPWAKHLSFDDFCAYVLPHRSTNEPLGDWREFFMEEYAWLQDSMTDPADPVEAAVLINNDIRSWFSFDPRFYEHPADQSYEDMLSGKRGRCEDMTNLAIFSMRANGIAVTSDYTPYWANTGNNHAWNAILDKEGNVSIFMGAEANPGEYQLSNRWAKVYRKTYAAQEQSLIDATGKPADSLPGYINRAYYEDVTPEYGKVSDVRISLKNPSEKVAYICVFNTGEWKAIHWAEIVDDMAVFTNMAREIMYLPAYYIDNEIVPAENPFILDKMGNVIPLEAGEKNAHVSIGTTTYRTTFATTDNIRFDKLKTGTEYELYYWQNGWQPAGVRTCEGKDLQFKDLPEGTLYWLKEKDGREEERIFTLTDDGDIKFW